VRSAVCGVAERRGLWFNVRAGCFDNRSTRCHCTADEFLRRWSVSISSFLLFFVFCTANGHKSSGQIVRSYSVVTPICLSFFATFRHRGFSSEHSSRTSVFLPPFCSRLQSVSSFIRLDFSTACAVAETNPRIS